MGGETVVGCLKYSFVILVSYIFGVKLAMSKIWSRHVHADHYNGWRLLISV